MASGFSSSNDSIYTKRALLIGNNKYSKNSELQYCINDAEDLADELREIDFEITIGTNLTYEQMDRMIETFNDKINPGDLVLFFFAGHGCQWSHLNFLIPIDDDRITTNTDLKYRAINVQATLGKIMSRHPSAAIFLLDCCRHIGVRGPSNSNGLSPMQAVSGSFIGYACDADSTSLDGSANGRNGLFTSHLLQHIGKPNLTIDEIMYDVCDGVVNEANDDQCPFRVSSLRRKVYLNQQSTAGQSVLVNHININTKWTRHGITIAGGNGHGNQLNQLFQPQCIYVDDDRQTIYIADCGNHRIVKWKLNSNTGQIIAGGNGNQNNQLSRPTDIIFDKNNNSFIISDPSNYRVIRYFDKNQTKQQIIISNIYCSRLTIDKNGFIYVSDWFKNEVRRWKEGDEKGELVAGGNGQGDRLNQLNSPTFIFIDEDYSLYISDRDNHRVMKWTKDAKEGITVAGGNGEGNSLKQLHNPHGVIVDDLDSYNYRVMGWCEGDKEGEMGAGGNGQGDQSNQLNYPVGLSFDNEENLYVADCDNDRIQKYEKI
ncbi:unnamed protein product [Adineta steineri]|uniref:Caspase family p20 domain-containing protein n=1 Tax=Adineta steineri TaxID=433720 RepID=A0A815S0H0_9BILA|nr:unnamed protein product [Adineta steineri]CAF4051719.1 unnamed protein product [Adineta steineri]